MFRIDYGTIGEATRTPQGGLAIPADLTRAGVFVYRNADGSERREWRPLGEVKRQATLDSLKAAPLTVRHPAPGRLEPGNHDKYSRGHVGDDVRMDGDKTAATLYAQGKEALDVIGKGWRHVSCGYDQDSENAPGTVPAGEPDAGQRYDAIQRNIVYNHVAIVPKGRAGDGVRLRLDAAGDSIREDSDMTKEIIGGTEYEVGTPAHGDARKRADAAEAERTAEVAKLRTDSAELRGKHDALAAEVAGYRKERADAAIAAERTVLVTKGAAVLGGTWKADGLSAEQITTAILAKQFPDVRLDEIAEAERPAYVKGLLATVKAPTPRQDAAPAKRVPQPQPFPGAPHAGQNLSLAEQFRSDAMDDACDGSGFAIQRRKPQPYIEPTMIENRS